VAGNRRVMRSDMLGVTNARGGRVYVRASDGARVDGMFARSPRPSNKTSANAPKSARWVINTPGHAHEPTQPAKPVALAGLLSATGQSHRRRADPAHDRPAADPAPGSPRR